MSASDIAARRIREARTLRKLTVKQLADLCKEAGATGLTAAVITNLETRRRPGREITADEVLALAWVLEVPPVQLLCPLDERERLEVVPGEEKGPMDAAAWLTDEDAILRTARPADSEDAWRWRGSNLAVIRRIRAAMRALRVHDHALSVDPQPRTAEHRNMITVESLHLLHLRAMLETLDITPPPLGSIAQIMDRYGFPPTLAEWEQLIAEERAAEEARNGEGP
jgi:transcriptional regulator with XRE-family HTH domain